MYFVLLVSGSMFLVLDSITPFFQFTPDRAWCASFLSSLESTSDSPDTSSNDSNAALSNGDAHEGSRGDPYQFEQSRSGLEDREADNDGGSDPLAEFLDPYARGGVSSSPISSLGKGQLTSLLELVEAMEKLHGPAMAMTSAKNEIKVSHITSRCVTEASIVTCQRCHRSPDMSLLPMSSGLT